MSDTSGRTTALDIQTVEVSRELAKQDAASTVLIPHMRGLDVLRGIAILLVLIYHGFVYSAPRLVLRNPALQALYSLTGWGWLGVNLFFVISGFLITGILQDSRSSVHYFQRFYARRALRILPAYVATLCLIWGFHLVGLPYVSICLLFLANMPGLLLPKGTALYGPLWSLAVEEQFYLVWPWLQRWIGRLGMLGVCVLLVLTCPLLRWLAAIHVLHMGEPNSKTWMVADNLAIGGVLALLARTPGITRKQFAGIGTVFLVIGAAGITWTLKRASMYDPVGRSVGLSCFMMFGAGMVAWAVCWYRVRPVPKAFPFSSSWVISVMGFT